MCIRYERDGDSILRWSNRVKAWVPVEDWLDELDAFPGAIAPIGLADPDHGIKLVGAQWGFIPFWAKEASFGRKSGYNARSETIADKPTWKVAVRESRCVIPATAFYERMDGHWFRFGVPEVVLFAGLYSGPNSHCPRISYAMVTTEPNGTVAEYHDRMPVVLSEADARVWLDAKSELPELIDLLVPARGVLFKVEDAGPITPPKPPPVGQGSLF